MSSFLVSAYSPGSPDKEEALASSLLDFADMERQGVIVLGSPPPAICFSRLDQLSPGYERARELTREMGLPAVKRISGGSAVAAHAGVLRIFLAAPHGPGDIAVRPRFSSMLSALSAALAALGVPVRAGQLPGEYCPGQFSLSHRGKKLVGMGQRSRRSAHHLCAMLSLSGSDLTASRLQPVYGALGRSFDPGRVGDLESLGVARRDAEQAVLQSLLDSYGGDLVGELPQLALDC